MNDRLHRFLIATAILASSSLLADEHTVKRSPLTIEKSIQTMALPADGTTLIPPRPVRWSNYLIEEIREHGAKVKGGENLLRYQTSEIDKALDETAREISMKTLVLEAAKKELSLLEQSLDHRMSQLVHAADTAKQEHEYFKSTRRTLDEQSADQRLEKTKQYLANEKEELEQLKKMYEADEVTEETEEIILTRQQNAVIAAEFALKLATENHRRTHETLLPREAISLSHAEINARQALEEGRRELPKAIETKKLEIDALSDDLARAKRILAELQQDRKHFELKAPASGWFVHGVIEDGKWNRSDASKSLHPGSSLPVNRPYATFVADSAKLVLFANVSGEDARCLEAGLEGTAYFAGKEESKVIATVETVSEIPDPDGSHLIEIRAAWTEKEKPFVGARLIFRVVTYHNESAIQVPTEAIKFGPDGFSVEVKLTDGKLARRHVKTGRISGDRTEIREGVEEGQVIIVP